MAKRPSTRQEASTVRVVSNVPGMVRPNVGGKLSVCRQVIWIVLFAFVLRVAVRSYTGQQDFWENGYTFFFVLAQNIAAGNGVSLGDALRPHFACRFTRCFLPR